MIAVTKTIGAILLALSLAPAAHAELPKRCVEESERLVGQRATLLLDRTHAPRKLTHVAPEYPTRANVKVRSRIWIGEMLLDQEGKVRDVWTIRPLRFEPAWPEYEDAIVAAIRRWTYEPAVVDGEPAPLCITVTANVEVR